MRKIFFLIPLLFALSCNTRTTTSAPSTLNSIAERYVRLGLAIGSYDPDFVDAYYGPDSLKPSVKGSGAFPKDSLLAAVDALQQELKPFADNNDTLAARARWISQQLTAFSRRIRIFSGERKPFDEEALELFGVTAPAHTADSFKRLLARLDSILPGKGDIAEKFQQLASRFVIPKDKIDTVFKTAIAEARRRTYAHLQLPAGESFKLEYVTGTPWSGYNFYQGGFKSLIQINTDQKILIERAIDVGSHESYPGHHVYNMLLEKNLYNDKGYVEISLYPLFSPQSLIAEGSAQYGIEVAFPGTEKNRFAKDVLLPLAGLDTTNLDLYLEALQIRSQLDYGRNEAARGLLNGTMSEKAAIQWLTDYCLSSPEAAAKSISFIKKYGSYVLNYNYGQELVKNYIESRGGSEQDPAKRWELFGRLLSNQVTTADLTQGASGRQAP